MPSASFPTLGAQLIVVTSLLVSALGIPIVAAADYADSVRATEGLLAHWRFEESDSSVAGSLPDLVAQPGGEISRGVDSALGSLGKALRLGPGGHVRLPRLGRHDAVSVEMWINVARLPAEPTAALYAVDNWEPGYLHFNLKSSGALELAIQGASSNPNSEPETVRPGRWLHLVVTYDARTGLERLFRDGRLIIETVVNPHPPVLLDPAALGNWSNGGQASRSLLADVDELAVYSVPLSQAQVRSHYLAAKGAQAAPVDFVSEVRPLLATHCVGCHGTDAQENQLRLDVRDWAFRGGESGEPAVVPYDTDASHLLARVTSKDREARMPPEDPRLSDAEVATLRNWIDQGAPWPDELAGHAELPKVETSHWSFQPLRDTAPPAIEHPFVASGNPIDAFILAGLNTRALSPSPAADRRTLARRLYLDMLGLPPSPEAVKQFIEDDAADAWEKLVDRVLASPQYGERWASHWLDVIRYADTHGFEVNTPRENSWPFRDYVIKSLNEDKPFDRFIVEQVAGDQLGVDSATGFLVAAPAVLPGQVGKDEPSIRQARVDELHEVIVSVGSGVLGLTIGCARCHNHKFDPISQRDYYQMQAIFAGLHYGDRPVRDPAEVLLPGGAAEVLPKAVFGGTFSAPGPTYRLYRGDPMQRRERVSPDVPAVFGSLGIESTVVEAERRMALARWLVDARNPLTPRVIVNRLWQQHFGTGLVATPSDFGAMGVPPSHPELLDWLARQLIDAHWSLKALHRLMLTSNTYRQASVAHELGLRTDAATQMLWRFPARRLEMEPIRDSILATSGALDPTRGGPGFNVFKPNDNYVRVYDAREVWGPDAWRRMIYVHRVRMAQDGVFGALDCPDAGQPAPRRSRSTTAIQALNLFNSEFIRQQAELLAKRVRDAGQQDLSCQVRRVFAETLAREPSAGELASSVRVAEEFGLPAVCRAVFNSNEFLFLP
ncbi:MAG TPA: DUF1553 domain-containing protein [Pirellulales bacterium]|jgi:mono/diheme cytochrome c family protein